LQLLVMLVGSPQTLSMWGVFLTQVLYMKAKC
jgi:hypothetical protein